MAIIDDKQREGVKCRAKIDRLQSEVRHRRAEYSRLCDAATAKVARLEEDLATLKAAMHELESHVSARIEQVPSFFFILPSASLVEEARLTITTGGGEAEAHSVREPCAARGK